MAITPGSNGVLSRVYAGLSSLFTGKSFSLRAAVSTHPKTLAVAAAVATGLIATAVPWCLRSWARHRTMRYVRNLTRPDPRYNKSSPNKPICPFMPGVLSHDGLRVVVVLPWEWSRLEDICRGQLQQQGADNHHSAAIVVVPFLPFERLMAVWRRLRLEALPVGKMFGEFHPQRMQPGLHTDAVFPLQTPLPVFGVRAMVRQDAMFFRKFESDVAVLRLFDDVFERRWGSRPCGTSTVVDETPAIAAAH